MSTLQGTWPLPESKLHKYHLQLKVVFLALKEFVSNNIVLVATDHTTVVAYINKEGGIKSGSLCALLWRILSWCTRKQVTLKACHIPGWLNVIPNMPWFCVLVAMSSQIPMCLPSLPNVVSQPFNQTLHKKPLKPEPTHLAPRATAIKEQGFSEAVAARI